MEREKRSYIPPHIGEIRIVVQEGSGSFLVIDKTTGNQFFRPGGTRDWFWLADVGRSPFGEDVKLGGQGKYYLNGIVDTAGFSLNHPPKK
ncbi:hypothetical protein KBI33_01190 [Candidatus Shapirobacteria bacterium]|nr:hypothetical protein [Candidatus Shapirobacteria bacterium]